MRKKDIRFTRENVTIEHASSRGTVQRNAGSFTRGSQLVTHQFLMTFAGIKVPLFAWGILFLIVLNITLYFKMAEHEVQLIGMKLLAGGLGWVGFNPERLMHLTLPNGAVQPIEAGYIPYHPAVALAWAKGMKCLLGSTFMSMILAVPATLWFVNFSRRRGEAILEERHERGAMLVDATTLSANVRRHNGRQLCEELKGRDPTWTPKQVSQMSVRQRRKVGIHVPYTLAGIPFPWRTEQSHALMIGTTGAGKTTVLRSLVTQMRARGDRAVIFDLTGSFVEAFYNEETDTILNPLDERCPAWTIFNDCANYAELLSASEALIAIEAGSEGFWEKAARTLFTEMLTVLRANGMTTNAAIAERLMKAELSELHKALEQSVAAPLTSEKAARMAESIRATFNTNAHVLRFLPDKGPKFSISDWIANKADPGSILFITSHQTDMTLTRPLLTMWTNIAVNALMRLPKTRDLRTWFLFDEVHALHRLPAIEDGMQAARNFGGGFILGIHSFAKLSETYGENGATHISSLARTKLILANSDLETAQKCAEYIGNREVRQMDEAYSYGYNNTRDASTLTPRKAVEPLVIPDDITNLPSLHGFVKFAEGFPAARIRLKYVSYPEIAKGYVRKPDPEGIMPVLKPAPKSEPPADDGQGKVPTGKAEPERTEPKTKDEMRSILRSVPSQAQLPFPEKGDKEGAEKSGGEQSGSGSASGSGKAGDRFATKDLSGLFSKDKEQGRGNEAARSQSKSADVRQSRSPETEERQESQIERENREGAGIEDDSERDDDHGRGD